MSYQLVIAEKPSVARSIAGVIGADKKQDGYMEGNGYLVSWCIGHLVSLADAGTYDERFKKWRYDDLPILPQEWQYIIPDDKKKQFDTLRSLMERPDVTGLVCAADAGREGELIFRFVYQMAGCKKPFQRLWISSMEDAAIKDGFAHLKPGADYDNLYQSALCRAQADWLVGINATRLFSILYHKTLTVGRVQTPTLKMLVDRGEAISHFKKEKYFTVELNLDGFSLSTDRIYDKIVAEQLLNLVGNTIEITDVIQKEKITKPELPFDLTTLQRECNKYFGYSAKQTLDYAQSLYEKKLITYPRTDSRCLTEDMITGTINNIIGKYDFDTGRIKTVFNSKKVTDHHAIIPTASSMNEDLASLPESELKVYELVLNKLHASVGYPLIENTTKIVAEFDGFEFTSSGKVIVDEGFTKYLNEYAKKKNEDTVLPDVKIGDSLDIKDKEIKEKYPSIIYFIDLHRDGIDKSLSTVTINNKTYAKMMFLLGMKHSNSNKNLEVVTKLNNYLNDNYKGLMRNIYKRNDITYYQIYV